MNLDPTKPWARWLAPRLRGTRRADDNAPPIAGIHRKAYKRIAQMRESGAHVVARARQVSALRNERSIDGHHGRVFVEQRAPFWCMKAKR